MLDDRVHTHSEGSLHSEHLRNEMFRTCFRYSVTMLTEMKVRGDIEGSRSQGKEKSLEG
jgi:hypothetical protein